jgi:hypothetical protein
MGVATARMSTSHITDHFTWAEAACHDGTEVPLELQPNARRLAREVLEGLRARFGGSLIPISWYRSPWHNKAVSGAEFSRHLTAEAADVRPADLTELPRLRAVVETMIHQGELPALGGLGVYPGWLHLDCRPRPPATPGHIARWFGRGVGSEMA